MTSSSPIFIATLGGKAQVVTFALDHLLAQRVPIGEVIVLHLAPPDPTHRLHRALMMVQREFRGGRYQNRACRLSTVPLRDRDGRRIPDMDSRAAVDGAWQTLNQLIGQLKAQNRTIHLSLAGGRRLVGLLAMSVAALHFTPSDRLWHLYTPNQLKQAAGEGQILHAPPNEPQPFLLEVPIMPGSETLPMLRHLLSASPHEVLAARRAHLARIEQNHCQQVWQELTNRQREVLTLLAQGKSPQDVGELLSITLATVSSHQHIIYQHCRNVWMLADNEQIDYHWLQKKFGAWVDLRD